MSKGIETREKIIQTTIEMLLQKGVTSSSVSDIVGEIGIQKGSLYYFFPSKDHLVIEALNQAKENFISFLNRSITGDTPPEKLENYFKAVLKYHQKRNIRGGCIFGNTALEMSERNERIRKLLIDVFTVWKERLRDILEEGVRHGYFRKDIDPEEDAWNIIAAIEGGIMLSKTFKNIRFLETTLENIKETILG